MANSDGDDPDSELPKGPSGGFGYGESGGDGAGRVSLSEAAQAVEDVLAGCRQELQFLRQRLQSGQEELDFEGTEAHQEEGTEEDFPTPSEQALRVASRLQACANALRNASTPEE